MEQYTQSIQNTIPKYGNKLDMREKNVATNALKRWTCIKILVKRNILPRRRYRILLTEKSKENESHIWQQDCYSKQQENVVRFFSVLYHLETNLSGKNIEFTIFRSTGIQHRTTLGVHPESSTHVAQHNCDGGRFLTCICNIKETE